MRGGYLIRYAREGLSPLSLLARTRLGYTGPPRFAGVKLSAPDVTASWGIAQQIAAGEYDFPGLTPQRGQRVIDVGANVGIYSLWAAKRGAKVVAYEPAPDTFACLVANTRRHGVEAIRAAVVGVEREAVPLYLHEERSTRHTLVGHEIGSGAPLTKHVMVPAAPIAEVLADGCDLLKIDCEGGEFGILAGAGDETLRRARRIVLEFHRTVGDPDVLLDRLAAAGFRAEVLAGDELFGVIGATL